MYLKVHQFVFLKFSISTLSRIFPWAHKNFVDQDTCVHHKFVENIITIFSVKNVFAYKYFKYNLKSCQNILTIL